MKCRGGGLARQLRPGWCRWLIAALVALLVAVPLGGAAAQAQRAQGGGGYDRGRVAHVAFLGALATGIVSELLSGALDEAKSQGFGWLMDQFGLGDGLGTELAGIRAQLDEIQSRLGEILAATTQLRAELAQGTYSGLVAQTTPIISRVDKGMDDLDALAHMTAGDPVKTEFAKETLNYIRGNLMQGQQEELAKRITGEAGADGLIVAASKAVKARSGHFWTKLTSDQVREVFNYYQSAEARLLLLRVEYMHAHPHIYAGSYIEGQIRKVETELRNQDALLKPSPPAFALVDTRTNLVWYLGFLDAQMTAKEATDFVDNNKASGRELPDPYAIQKLIEGWHGANWAVWLDQQIGGQLGALKPFYGVWTSSEYACEPVGNPLRPSGTLCSRYAVNSDGKIQVRDERDGLGVLRVKARTEDYWW